LRFEGYEFDGRAKVKEAPWKKWMEDSMGYEWWKSSGPVVMSDQSGKSNLALWMDAIDWSGIEQLAISGPRPVTDEVLQKVPGALSSLRSLETTNTSFIVALPVNTLETLKVVGGLTPGD
jgi:hypothetical protein